MCLKKLKMNGDTRDAGFHTSVAVAFHQSGSKSCGLWDVLQERGYRKKIRTVEELQ